MLYVPNFIRSWGDSADRIGLLPKKEVSDIKVFFHVNIFIIKQSMLLIFLRLLRIFSSGDWKHKKRDHRIYLQIFQGLDYGPLAQFWENFGVTLNEPFYTEHYGIWHHDNKRLCESLVKKASSIKLQNLATMISSE